MSSKPEITSLDNLPIKREGSSAFKSFSQVPVTTTESQSPPPKKARRISKSEPQKSPEMNSPAAISGKATGKGEWRSSVDELIQKLMSENRTFGDIANEVNRLPRDINPYIRTKNAISKRWRKTIKPSMEAGKEMSEFEWELLKKAVKAVEGDDKFTYVAEHYGKLLAAEKEAPKDGEFKKLTKTTALELWKKGAPKKEKDDI